MVCLRLRLCLCLAFLLLNSALAWGKRGDNSSLAVSKIPESLLANGSHSVLRYGVLEMTVNNLHDIEMTREYAVTVLDEKGKTNGYLQAFYGKFSTIQSIEGAVYDASGNFLRKLKKNDISDRSTYAMSGIFYSDQRMKRYDFVGAAYPYTVVYKIKKKNNNTFFLPSWHPQVGNTMAVQHAKFILSYPAKLEIRSKGYNIPRGAVTTVDRNNELITKTWSLNNIPSFRRQPLSDSTGYSLPVVVNAASDFELFNYAGNMARWDSLGSFIYRLNQDRDKLPENIQTKVRALVAGDTSIFQKVQTLYTFMQENTRYVADEYGLAQWQTFSAEEVCRKGYGDCKGLTNYMKALLKEAGIISYSCLINAGPTDYHVIDTQFPTATFNHDILCIPNGNDSIWLECTSSVNPAGYMGAFTQNRKVLVTTPNGGHLTNMPFYGKDNSYRIRNTTMTFEPSSARQHLHIHSIASGILQDRIAAILKNAPPDDITKFYNRRFSFPSYSVKHFDYKVGRQSIPKVEENVAVEASGFVTTTPQYTFINIGWLSNPMPEIVQAVPRTKPIVLKNDFKIIDSISVMLPPNFVVESVPAAVHLKFPFGSYDCKTEQTNGRVQIIRIYQQNHGIFDVKEYEHYQKMYHTIDAGSRNLNIVLSDNRS